ncbi:hypothetical protein HELRODRAFT_188549 [Helobdella robusta]|uniref:BTB domain-containing protein n=1 Tax=Helobdella robusta TaxID=6412 RepID=T1FQ40_HELRO|nr:hypothetical protein HELRODRAFT_188549 [Helobdella robusta]ESO02000.1 hypothetical protein HELRODRAFT_188549 [Helobdella robusta]
MFLNVKEPSGISVQDGKRPDGCTLTPWRAGKCLAWDVTVPGTLAERYVHLTSKECGLAAIRASDEKIKKYEHALPSLDFLPIYIEVLGPMDPNTLKFIKTLCKMIGVRGYFKSMFLTDMSESRNGVVKLEDIDPDATLSLVQYAYTSQLLITVENVQPLLFASSILQIDSVSRTCCEFMASHLDETNCLEVLSFANHLGHKLLVNKAQIFIIRNFREISQIPELLKLSYKLFLPIICADDLCVDREEDVYDVVIKWIKYDVVNNIKYIVPLLKNIRFTYFLPSTLVDIVSTEELIRTNLDCRDLVDDAKDYCLFKANVIYGYKGVKKHRPRKIYSGVMFCVGGRGFDGNPFKSIECYDVYNDRTIILLMKLKVVKYFFRNIFEKKHQSKLFAAGGHDGVTHLKSGEMFDPQTNTWTPIADMSKLRRGIALAYLNGSIYAVGGLDDHSCFPTVERYDIASDTWFEVKKMNYSRGGVALVSYQSSLYAVGGNDGSLSLESCESYDSSANNWVVIEPMNKRRAGAGATELDGYIYVAGGFDDNAPLDSVERYNVADNQWTIITPMSRPRGGVGISSLAGKIFAVGGHDGHKYLDSVEEYDPEKSEWSQVAKIGTCRAGAGVVTVLCSLSSLVDITNSISTSPGDII